MLFSLYFTLFATLMKLIRTQKPPVIFLIENAISFSTKSIFFWRDFRIIIFICCVTERQTFFLMSFLHHWLDYHYYNSILLCFFLVVFRNIWIMSHNNVINNIFSAELIIRVCVVFGVLCHIVGERCIITTECLALECHVLLFWVFCTQVSSISKTGDIW